MSLASLRLRLALLVGLGLLPVLAILVWFGTQHRDLLGIAVQREAERTAALAGELHARALAETDGLLDGLARLPAVIEGPGDACQAVLRGLLGGRYLNLGVAGVDGAVWCSATPLDAPVTVADRKWFQEAFTAGTFVLGEYQVGRVTGGPVLTVARPVRDSAGLRGVVFAGIDLRALGDVADSAALPPGSFVVLTDRNGITLTRSPPAEGTVGRSFVDTVAAQGLLGMPAGVADQIHIGDGVYLLAHAPLAGVTAAGAHVFVAIPRQQAFAPVDHLLQRVFVGVFATTLAVLGLVWVASDVLLVRRARALVHAAERLGAGDLGARVGLAHGPDEFGRLSAAFDQMAANIERLTALHRQTIEAAGEGIVTLTPNGRVSSANPAAARLLGLRPDQVVGASAHALFHGYEGSGHEDADCPLKAPARDGAEQRSEEDSFQRAGAPRFPASWVASPLRDGDRVVGVALIFADESHRRRLEDQLRQAAKMEAVGQLAGGVAHDFNNLLTAILGYADLLRASLGPDHRGWRDADEIVRAAHRASALTRQLLAFSRRRETAVRVLELNRVVADLEKMLRRLIGEHIDLEVILGDGVGTVRADAGQLEQVILNLTVNARDAMPTGGRVLIETSTDAPEDASGAEAWVCVAVTDHGEGIPPEALGRLFEPFYTTKASGTGLGLSTVARIVRGSGGQVSCASVVGEGTTFRVYLPVVTDASDVSWPRQPAIAASGTETILLVEDEDAVRDLVRRTLEPLGYHILEAANGAVALARAREATDGIALLLTDVVMPGMNGADLYAALTPTLPALRVLYMSGYEDGGGTPMPAMRGAWLAKPFTPGVLAQRVRDVLDAPG